MRGGGGGGGGGGVGGWVGRARHGVQGRATALLFSLLLFSFYKFFYLFLFFIKLVGCQMAWPAGTPCACQPQPDWEWGHQGMGFRWGLGHCCLWREAPIRKIDSFVHLSLVINWCDTLPDNFGS